MSTFKKLLALTLALAMVLSVSAFAGSYKADTYKDAASIDDDAAEAIELLYALDIMKGDENGNFNPTATITRAEMAKMIYVVLNYGKDDKAVNYTGARIFSDVPAGAWYEGYVNFMATTKLAQGDGKGNFMPNAPITCAEAAKLLLTAIGYSSEARGYTGANWAQNVLADASILGLLKGYEYNTNTYAPRQWVAVMFENMLYCLTYKTMMPSFSGLLISGDSVNAGDSLTMGYKYYGLKEYTGYLYATNNAYIDKVVLERNKDDEVTKWLEPTDETGDYTTSSGKVLFSDGDDNDYLIVKSSDVGVYDLGQEFRIIYKDNSSKTVYSITATGESVTDECMVKDIESEITHGNYDNDRDNDFVFTVGDFTGWLNYGSAKVAELASNGNFKNYSVTAKQVYDKVGDDEFVRTDMVKVVDRNGNGSIDYVIYTAYDYAQVDSVKNNKYHGDYITATKLLDKEALKYGTDSKLYLDEVIVTDDEIAEDDYIKYSWNYDEDCYEIEVLDVVAATYEAKNSKDVYTFSGDKYLASAKGIAESCLDGEKKGSDWNIVVDDNLLVIAFKESSKLSLDDLNGKLALVIGVTENYDSGRFFKDRCAIRVLTIAGGDEPIDLVYDVDAYDNVADDYAGAATMTWDEVSDLFLGTDDDKVEEVDLTKYANIKTTQPAQLYILHIDEDTEEAWLEALPEGVIANTKDNLKYDQVDEDRDLDVEEGTIGAKDVVTENTFFLGSLNSSGSKVTYSVKTLDELGAVTIGVKHSEFIYKDLSVDSIRGGYALYKGSKLNGEGDTGYAWIDSEIDYVGKYNTMYADLLTSDQGTLEYVNIDNAEGTTLEAGELYAYEYDLDDECYVLTAIDWPANLFFTADFETSGQASEIVRITEKKLTLKKPDAAADSSDDDDFRNYDIKDYPIALRVDLYERDNNNTLEDRVTELYFVTAADLAEGNVTIDTFEVGEISIDVVNGAKIDDTFIAKSNSKLIIEDGKEIVAIHVLIEEMTKQ